jgi:protein-disulfide isomerase
MSHLFTPVNEKDHIQGSPNSPVTLVEFGDYQCPLCRMTAPIIKQLQKELGEHLRVVFRHFPLKTSHPYAMAAAQAAEAANLQNKFWEMHDLLFGKQFDLNPEIGTQLAEHLQLDIEKFKADLLSPDTAQKIEEDFIKGVRSGVNCTPCFYINGVRYDGDRSYSAFKQALVDAQKT